MERQTGVAFTRVITYSLVGMFLFFFMTIYIRVKTFDADTFVVELQKQSMSALVPIAQRDLVEIERVAVPAITKALRAEAAVLVPKISEKLQEESAIFQDNMGRKLRSSMETHFLTQLTQNQDVLSSSTSRFARDSDLYDDLVRRLEVTARLWAQDTLDNVFHEHVIVLQSINQSVKKLQATARADVHAGKVEEADDVLLLLVDILNARLEE